MNTSYCVLGGLRPRKRPSTNAQSQLTRLLGERRVSFSSAATATKQAEVLKETTQQSVAKKEPQRAKLIAPTTRAAKLVDRTGLEMTVVAANGLRTLDYQPFQILIPLPNGGAVTLHLDTDVLEQISTFVDGG